MSERDKTILIADDDDLDARLTKRAIERELPNVQIVSCGDGVEALHALESMDTPPTLILMDYKMPRMGCLDVLRSLPDPNLKSKVPIVLFSSSVGPSDVEECIEEGAREYVQKPTDPEQYDRAVAGICRAYVS